MINISGHVKSPYLMLGLCLCMLLILTACGSSDEDEAALQTEVEAAIAKELENPVAAADTLYNQATDALHAKKYKEAARLYEDLERKYPYSKWATKSQLMAAYAIYADLDYERALSALDRFIELHPGNKDVDYALYLKALSHYEQITDVKRDQRRTQFALNALNTVIRRFPESEYARDARFKRDLTLNHLAGKEMEVGRYYLKRNEINAAINRFKNVVENYQTTTHVPEALHRLVEAYRILGLEGEAKKIAAILGHNYPGSQWYEFSYRLFDEEEFNALVNQKSWMEKTLDGFLPGSKDKSDEKPTEEIENSQPVEKPDEVKARDEEPAEQTQEG